MPIATISPPPRIGTGGPNGVFTTPLPLLADLHPAGGHAALLRPPRRRVEPRLADRLRGQFHSARTRLCGRDHILYGPCRTLADPAWRRETRWFRHCLLVQLRRLRC